MSSPDRIRDLLQRLAPTLDAIDLDTIDGEFFWRGCRADLNPIVERVRSFGPPVRVEEVATLAGRLRHDEWVRLREEAGQVIPLPVLDALVAGEPVSMRMPEIGLHQQLVPGSTDYAQWASVMIYSGAWTGRDVERGIVRAYSWVDRPHPGLGADWISVHLDFAFIEDEMTAKRFWRSLAPLRMPFVGVLVGSPLPPPGAITREYDAIVRDLHGWHHRLPGAVSRQDKEVALRTWAVSLLMASGVKFNTAMRQVEELAHVAAVSQTRFGQDRQRLVERVPEARPYVYARA